MTTSDQLEAAIRRARDGEDGALARLAAALLDADLIVPVDDDGGAGGPRLVTLLHEGAPYVPAYTRPDLAAGSVPAGQPTATVPVRALVEAWDPGTSLALNPGAEPAGWLDGGGVLALRGGERLEVPAGTPVRVGAPATEPTALLAAAAAQLGSDARVLRAHHALAWFEAHGEVPHLVIAVVTDEPADDVGPRLAAALPPADGPVDVLVVVEDRPHDELTSQLLSVPPFHRRDG